MTVKTKTVVQIIIILFLLIVIITFVYYPLPVKYGIDKFVFSPVYDANSNANIFEDYTLYDKKTNNTKLLIYFHGGAFLFSNQKSAYGLLNELDDSLTSFDILTFSYPVRFKYTLQDSLLSINKIIQKVQMKYTEFYAVGMSAGVLLMGAFQRKEKNIEISKKIEVPIIGVQFKAMVGICGVYDTRIDNQFLQTAFNFYIMRNTPSPKEYTCYNLKTPILVISSISDYLYNQSYRYIQQEPNVTKYIFNTYTPHQFSLLINLPEATKTVKKISEFLIEHSKTSGSDDDNSTKNA